MEKDITWKLIKDKARYHRHHYADDAFQDDEDIPIRMDEVNSDWPEDDWLNLLEFNPGRYLTTSEDDLETERLMEIEENQEWYEQDLNREPMEDDDVYLSRIRVREEYEYTTEDFADEFFGGTDSPEWESLFP